MALFKHLTMSIRNTVDSAPLPLLSAKAGLGQPLQGSVSSYKVWTAATGLAPVRLKALAGCLRSTVQLLNFPVLKTSASSRV